jgi:hypothetical protein
MLFYCASSGKSPDQIPPRPPGLRTMRRHSRSSDRRFRCIQLPWVFDALRDFLKFKTLPFRHTLGRRRFSTDRLYATGDRHRYGISELHVRALDSQEIRDCEAFAFSSKRFAALLTSLRTTHQCREKQAGQDWAAGTNVRIGRRCMHHFQPTRR